MIFRLFTASVLLTASAVASPPPGMVFIPGGEFLRGRSQVLSDDDLKWYPTLMKDDRPVRPIRIDPFYLDQYEVTNAQYAEFVAATGHRPPYNWPKGQVPEGKGSYPVVDVDWDDASAFAKWAKKRLPTEAEWERACRGLAEKDVYPWGNRKPTKEDARFNVLDGPGPVGKCKANYFGLYDMAGNVWEWTADWYDKDYYRKSPETNPKGPEQGMYRVVRGGSWSDIERNLTCAYRSWVRPTERGPNIGFRCARDFK